MWQSFDATRLQLIGDPTPIADGLRSASSGATYFSASDTGVLVYAPAPPVANRRLVWVDRRGVATPLSLAPGAYEDPSLSPDGRQLALAIHDADRTDGASSIWVYDIERGALGKRTFEGANAYPIWTRDGQYVTFTRGPSLAGPIMRVRADGSGQPENLVTDAQRAGLKVATSWSADGQFLAFQSGRDVIVRDPNGRLQPALTTPAFEREGRFSPNGRWMAYRSDETGRDEVYVQPYPPGAGKWQISTDGGAQPMWAPNGKELFSKNGNRMMAVDVEVGTTFKASSPRALFEIPMALRDAGDPSRYGVTPDAQRFLVATPVIDESAGQSSPLLQVVVNWQSAKK